MHDHSVTRSAPGRQSGASSHRCSGRYKPMMRRRKRLVIAAVVLLLVLAGAYTAAWFYAAQRVRAGLPQWAASMRQQHLELSWKRLRIAGFPLAFRLELAGTAVHDRDPRFTADVKAPALSASARPWNPFVWH